ncbi:hypothetical protein F4818DRAFT_446560 [Hypoxylon cercidicola]|nr:hypothetical protein F4818DRAFT_446560 [Hypoxylon cercidicola]
MGKHSMSKSDASQIQSSQARNDRDMSSSGFAARAQSAGDRNEAALGAAGQQNVGTGTGSQSGNYGGSTGSGGGRK